MSEHNPPAFPRVGEGKGNPHYDEPGMTLRDWFAGQALAGAATDMAFGDMTEEEIKAACAEFAGLLYGIADAMLAARARGEDR